jgi:hypothetical protein
MTYITGVAFSSATTLWVRGDYLGLISLNITNPSSPVELGKIEQGGNEGRIYSYSHYIIAMGRGNFQITDATDPAKPVDVTAVATSGAIFASFSGSTMFLADGATGFSEFSLADPAAPVMQTYFASPTFSFQGAILQNGARFLSSREGGLWILLPSSCSGANLYLPCQGSSISPFSRPLFSWKPVTGLKYAVQISQYASFSPKKSILSSDTSEPNLKVPYYQTSDQMWNDIMTKVRKHGPTLYWRVAYKDGNKKTYSEIRTLSIP